MEETRSCPICKQTMPKSAMSERYRPFCSKRCADVDLSRWLNGVYAIPAAASDESEILEDDEGNNHPSLA